MTDLYLLTLLGLLLAGYGIRSRCRILRDLDAGWRWSGTATRAALWLIYGILGAFQGSRTFSSLLLILAGVLLTELAAFLHRRFLKRTTGDKSPHGSVRAHLSVILLALFPPVGLALISPWIHGGPAGAFKPPDLALLPWVTFAVALWSWATLVTVSVIDLVRPDVLVEQDKGAGDWGRGEIIGVLERLITFALIAAGSPGAVGLVVAAKAAARFPEFKDAEFAEYFLVGTLTSIGLAVALSLLLTFRYP